MTATFFVGDAIEVMSKLPEKSVDLILTSPPFLALRSYLPADHPDKALEGGSQATPGAFIDWLVDVVEACDRVLAPHGSLCIELGDTYAGSGGAGGDYDKDGWRDGQPTWAGSANRVGLDAHPDGFTGRRGHGAGGGPSWPLPKSLSLIPELFRLTLVYGTNPLTGRQTERWRLRNVVRWVRPNPPVGALGDKFRPATSELMVFCKSAKRYFDLDAVREPSIYADRFYTYGEGIKGASVGGRKDKTGSRSPVNTGAHPNGAPPLDWWNIPLLEGEEETRYGPKAPKPSGGPTGFGAWDSDNDKSGVKRRVENTIAHELGAPPLDWWNIPPGGYEGAHYAVFSPELCIKPIKAMSPERVCRQCGEPSRRIVENTYEAQGAAWKQHLEPAAQRHGLESSRAQGMALGRATKTVTTLGFSDCGHDDWRPGLVLDPFVGSGTTLMVATGHGRDAIGIDLDERNYDLALERVGPFILSRAESV